MFIIVEYISKHSTDNINLVLDDGNGEVLLFDFYEDAEDYAIENGAWNYKIVELWGNYDSWKNQIKSLTI